MLPLARVVQVALEAGAKGADQGQVVPVCGNQVDRVVLPGPAGVVADLQVQVRPAEASVLRVTAERDHLALLDLLARRQIGPLQQMAVERGVAELRMVDDQVVRQRAVGCGVHQRHHAVGDGYDLGAAGCGEIDAEVDALAVAVGGVAVEIRADRVAVGLAKQPGVRAGRLSKGQDEGPLTVLGLWSLVGGSSFRERGLGYAARQQQRQQQAQSGNRC